LLKTQTLSGRRDATTSEERPEREAIKLIERAIRNDRGSMIDAKVTVMVPRTTAPMIVVDNLLYFVALL
jgi:hypothetical protein